MDITALDLFNKLKEYSEEELKNTKIAIEQNRKYKKTLADTEYANVIEEYKGEIRLACYNNKDSLAFKYRQNIRDLKYERIQLLEELTEKKSKIKKLEEDIDVLKNTSI